MASVTPDLWLSSQIVLVPNYTAWWQRHVCVNNLAKDAPESAAAGVELVTCWLQVQPLPLCHRATHFSGVWEKFWPDGLPGLCTLVQTDKRSVLHSVRIIKQQCRINARLNSFACRNVNAWNSLPENAVWCHSRATFKLFIDMFDFSKFLTSKC